MLFNSVTIVVCSCQGKIVIAILLLYGLLICDKDFYQEFSFLLNVLLKSLTLPTQSKMTVVFKKIQMNFYYFFLLIYCTDKSLIFFFKGTLISCVLDFL